MKKFNLPILGLAVGMLALGFFTIFINLQSQPATATDGLPPLKVHLLPASLARWEDETDGGDYFEEVEATAAGYLIWSRFPIAVYVEPPREFSDSDVALAEGQKIEPPDKSDRSREWVETVTAAVREWDAYLPLEMVEEGSQADVVIINKRPPISLDNMRARSAEARYEFYLQEIDGREILAHRFVIWLSPMQRGKYLPAAARHEFGHALGIWGHSLEETDVMYYSQVGEPPPISARDVNTLKGVYQQPTRLGWEFGRE